MNADEWDDLARRHEGRRKAFIAAGLSEDAAFDLAERMFDRDRDPLDERRLCFECRNFVKGTCLRPEVRGSQPAMFMLQKCPNFNLRGAKK